MDTLKIDTSQNIEIEQAIASIGERVAATLLDLLFISMYIIVFVFIFRELHNTTIILIGTLPSVLYGLICELTMNGQSWGKKILKIKVIKTDGTNITFSSYFLRWITGLIEVYAFLGSIATFAIIFSRKGQRLGDIAANTAVIRLRDKSLNQTIYTQVTDDYTVVYPESSQLSTNDIYTIQEVLELIKSSDDKVQSTKIAQKAQKAIEKKLNIKSDQNMIAFLKTLISDYNFINKRL